MPIPRPRFTVRRLMIAVAILALLMGGALKFREWRRFAATYRAKAQEHADVESMLRSIAAIDGDASPVDISLAPNTPTKRFPIRDVADHEARLRRKYERAASRPWFPISPDSPTPE